jgi:hypothetical protein
MMQVPGVVAPTREVVESARRLLPQPETQELTLYCPLTVCVEDDDGCDLVETDPHILAWFEGEISAALRDEISEGENMADYLDEPLKGKIASVEFDVARFGELLYGKVSCNLRVPLTADEQSEFVDWATGQASDGLGEGFEQRPVSTSEGDLYVSLWHGGADYFMLPEQEFLARLDTQTLDTQGLGEATPHKPERPLIGADGNVFNLIGLAAATLRENGLAEQAKEMRSRAMDAGSYDGALGVIMEYVEPVCAEGFEDEDEDWCNEPENDEDLDTQGFGGMGGMC